MRQIILAFLLAVAACGGSGMDDPSVSTPPIAIAAVPRSSSSEALTACPLFEMTISRLPWSSGYGHFRWRRSPR